MKKQTLEEIVRLISEEEMSPDDVRNIMGAIRKQDAVAGDIVVCIDDVDDIIYESLGEIHVITREMENGLKFIVDENVGWYFDMASERFWDSFIDDISEATKKVIDGEALSALLLCSRK